MMAPILNCQISSKLCVQCWWTFQSKNFLIKVTQCHKAWHTIQFRKLINNSLNLRARREWVGSFRIITTWVLLFRFSQMWCCYLYRQLSSRHTHTQNNNMNKRIIIITFIMMMAKLYTHREIHSEGRMQ